MELAVGEEYLVDLGSDDQRGIERAKGQQENAEAECELSLEPWFALTTLGRRGRRPARFFGHRQPPYGFAFAGVNRILQAL